MSKILEISISLVTFGAETDAREALRDRKQLLWRSLTKDFHENGKVEVNLRCFEVEILTKL